MIEEIYNKYSFSLIALLILHAVAQNVMLASSNRNTTITFPPERKVIKENNHTTAQKNFLGNDAHWIWVNGTDASNYGFLAIFQALFYADCPDQDSEVKITGYDIFTAYLNGIHVGAGENYRFLYFFKAKLICGLNNLTIIVMNKDQSASGSLIFSLTQDRTSCYLCKENPSGIYDRNTCKCECSAYMSNFPA